MEFAQACVDGGVPVFWTGSGDSLTAGLVFRVGQADEPLARRGITHLIEHLALYPLGVDAHMHHNGQVDAVTTTFLMQGDPGEVASFFDAVCANLRELPLDRLADEKQVLRTEAGRRELAISDMLLIASYGADTYGRVAYREYGLKALDAAAMRAWARRYFTCGNAAMWITGGPPPDGLRLDLPDGPAMPAPSPARSESRTPGWATAPAQGVGWSGLVRRSTPAEVYASVLHSRLLQELRHNLGISYSPSVSYAVRDQDMAHVTAVADGLEDVHSTLVQAFIGELERLQWTAITDDELLSTVSALRAAAGTSRGAAQYVAGAARDAIMGRPVESTGAWREAPAAVSAADVQQVAKEAFGSSLFVVPPRGHPRRAGFTQLSGSSDSAVAGRKIRSADYPLDRTRLVIGDDGVSLVRGEAIATVRYAQCAALLKWPDGARQLIGHDAVSIRIEPTLWRLKQHAASLEEKVPAGQAASMPMRDTVPRPWTGRPIRIAGWLLAGPTAAFLTGTVPVTVLLILLALLMPGNGGVFVMVLVAPAMAVGAVAARNVRARLLTHAARHTAQRR